MLRKKLYMNNFSSFFSWLKPNNEHSYSLKILKLRAFDLFHHQNHILKAVEILLYSIFLFITSNRMARTKNNGNERNDLDFNAFTENSNHNHWVENTLKKFPIKMNE